MNQKTFPKESAGRPKFCYIGVSFRKETALEKLERLKLLIG